MHFFLFFRRGFGCRIFCSGRLTNLGVIDGGANVDRLVTRSRLRWFLPIFSASPRPDHFGSGHTAPRLGMIHICSPLMPRSRGPAVPSFFSFLLPPCGLSFCVSGFFTNSHGLRGRKIFRYHLDGEYVLIYARRAQYTRPVTQALLVEQKPTTGLTQDVRGSIAQATIDGIRPTFDSPMAGFTSALMFFVVWPPSDKLRTRRLRTMG